VGDWPECDCRPFFTINARSDLCKFDGWWWEDYVSSPITHPHLRLI
jgi:hypothetical protein